MLAPSNSKSSSKAENSSLGSLPKTFTSRFNLPLCAIPKQICDAPIEPQFWITLSTRGTNASAPSIPKRFIPGYFADRYLANPSAEFSRSNMFTFSSSSKTYSVSFDSNFFWNHLLSSESRM